MDNPYWLQHAIRAAISPYLNAGSGDGYGDYGNAGLDAHSNSNVYPVADINDHSGLRSERDQGPSLHSAVPDEAASGADADSPL